MQKSLFSLCFALLLYYSSADAQNLSVERYAPLVVRVGNQVLFGNGQQYGGKFTNRVDIYDNNTGAWSNHDLIGQEPYAPSIVAGDKVVYYPNSVAGDTLDIYDAATGTWSIHLVPDVVKLEAILVAGDKVVFKGIKPDFITLTGIYILNTSTGMWSVKIMEVKSPYIGSILNKIMVVGGYDSYSSNAVNYIQMYDLDQESWSSTTLSEARKIPSPAIIGSKIIFAGGRIQEDSNEGSTQVDIYDAASNTWSMNTLPWPISDCISAVVGTKAIFVINGSPKNIAYIYSAESATWSSHELSRELYLFSLSVVGNKALIAGGYDYDLSIGAVVYPKTVEIFDAGDDTWHTSALSVGRIISNVVVQDDKIIYLGHKTPNHMFPPLDVENFTPAIDIYNSTLDQWSSYSSENASFTFAVTDSKLYLAGGRTLLPNGLARPSEKVDVFDFSNGLWSAQPLQIPRAGLSMAAFSDKVLIVGGRPEIAPGFFHKATTSVETFHD